MRGAAALLSCLVMFGVAPARAQVLPVLYNDEPPYITRVDGRVKGITGAATEAAFVKAGVPFVWRETSAERQIDLMRRGEEAVCASSWFRTPEREAFARFTKPIHQEPPMAILGRADDRRLSIRHDLDALLSDSGLRLLMKKSYSYGSYIDSRIVRLSPRRAESTLENLPMAKLIAAERADYMFVSEEEGEYLLSRDELRGDRLKLFKVDGMPGGATHHIMCSLKVPFEIIERLDAVID